MKFYIDNFDLENRGNQLMIQSVVDQIRNRYTDNYTQIFVCERVFMQNPSYCFANKLYPLAKTNTGKRHCKPVKTLTNFLLGTKWITTPDEIDVILNCQGYCYSDHFIQNEEDYSYYGKNYYASFTKPNRKIILLPQAFGPYENEWSKRAMREIYQIADKIYCREKISFKHLKNILPDTSKVSLVSDFTCLCKPAQSLSIYLPSQQYVLLVPNFNMLRYINREKYLYYLSSIVKHLSKTPYSIYLLNHEGIEDLNILKELNQQLDTPLPIITNLSAFEDKAIINNCKLLISDRFHALVSGLTQGVPCLYAGWSYKYEELFKEHNCTNSRLEVKNIDSSIKIISEAINTPQPYISKAGCEKQLEDKVKDMWEEVFKYIKNDKV